MATSVDQNIPPQYDQPDLPKGGTVPKQRPKPSPLEPQVVLPQQTMPAGTLLRPPSGIHGKDKERKIGHRRVDHNTGMVTYKKKPTSELMAAIQLGIGQSVGGLSSKPERDVLMQDFAVVESVFFPSEGSNLTPAHHLSDFRFKTYAPVAFRYFRELFGIQPDDFLLSLCDEGLKELSNPGASGSIFYLTNDDEFIIKTVQHKEADFLQKLLPGYYMNLNQNPCTLLPKFYGLYCYQCGGKNIRFVVMNNLLPTSVKMHEKYDLKGSTYKRKASKHEREKSSPVFKDLDFLNNHAEGIYLEKDKYDALIRTLTRDCRVLESFKIMDYSMLVGIYNVDIADREKGRPREDSGVDNSDIPIDGPEAESSGAKPHTKTDLYTAESTSLARTKSMKTRLAQYSTAIESISARQVDDDEEEDEDIPPGGIPAKNNKGERLLMFIGIIDILQSYRLKKKLEHTMKSIVIDGDSISVHRPSFYCSRFQDFMSKRVFKKLPTPIKHSPSKRKPVSSRRHTTSEGEPELSKNRAYSDDQPMTGTTGRRPDLVPENSTPPPTFAEALATRSLPGQQSPNTSRISYTSRTSEGDNRRLDYSSSGKFTVTYQEVTSQIPASPNLSLSESTPTHTDFTEGTPSYTPSTPSCYSEIEQSFQAELDSPVKSVSTTLISSTETSYASAVETQDTEQKSEDTTLTSEGESVANHDDETT